MHGLPAEKKRELEQILRTFATGLDDSPSQPSPSARAEKLESSYGSVPEPVQKTLQDPMHADSGYASISVSGINSSSQTGGLKLRDEQPVSKSKKESDIKSYLHDIPDSLLPREHSSVSDNAKMQLVVQRMEHLFTGKRAAPGEHSLPIQQQKISRSAAKADRREDRRQNRTSRLEGSREAPILPPDSKMNFDAMEAATLQPGNRSTSDLSSIEGSGAQSGPKPPGSPDQRPTRPLDLDIHRAQVAADNIEYIRHLGFSSPQFEEREPDKEQPWIYLNLLVSMAQLHTLNVTPAFVRKAIKNLSTKFELSKDGHKIRWIRDDSPEPNPLEQVSPLSGPNRGSEDTGDDGGRRSGRSTTSTLNNVSASASDSKGMGPKSSNASKLLNSTTTSSNLAHAQPSTTQSKSTSAFDYKPIVFQGKRTFLKSKNSYLDSSSSYDDLSPESNEAIPVPTRSSPRSQDESYEGYATFFSNPYYFTDLSGDKTSARAGQRGPRDVLGIKREKSLPVDDTLRDVQACYFLSPRPTSVASWSEDSPEMELYNSSLSMAGEDETQPIELEASGVGGVRPEDNFALDVHIARKRRGLDKGKGVRRLGDKQPSEYSYDVANCTKIQLQPSRLPPPSYVFFTTSSSSEAGKGHFYDGDSSDESSEAENSPAPAGIFWQWSSSSNERLVDNDDASVASSSLGVLEAARARVPPSEALNGTGRPMSGSLAATAGASWSAASNAPDVETGREFAKSVSSMEF